MTENRRTATPTMLGAIYFGCAVIASAVLSIFLGIVGALAR